MQSALTVIISLAGLYGVLLVAAMAGQRLLVYPWWLDMRAKAPPRVVRSGLREIVLETPDDNRLKALWLPPEAGAPVIVSFHGIRGFHWTNALRFASGYWRGHGYGVFAPAMRGYHGSTGWPDEKGLSIDADAAIEFVRSNAPGADIIIHGHSLGSAIATAAAARHECRVLVLESPFTALPEVGALWYPFFPVRRLLRDLFPTARLILESKAGSVIILHGTEDRSVPFRMSEELARIREDAVFIPLPGEGHTGFQDAADEALRPLTAHWKYRPAA